MSELLKLKIQTFPLHSVVKDWIFFRQGSYAVVTKGAYEKYKNNAMDNV